VNVPCALSPIFCFYLTMLKLSILFCSVFMKNQPSATRYQPDTEDFFFSHTVIHLLSSKEISGAHQMPVLQNNASVCFLSNILSLHRILKCQLIYYSLLKGKQTISSIILNPFVLPFYNVGIISGKLLAASFWRKPGISLIISATFIIEDEALASSAGIIISFQSCVYMLS